MKGIAAEDVNDVLANQIDHEIDDNGTDGVVDAIIFAIQNRDNDGNSDEYMIRLISNELKDRLNQE